MMAGDSLTCRKPGREQAFLELIVGVEDELHGFIRHRVGSRDRTEDFVQKTFLLAWSNAEFEPAHIHARAWLFKTARRLIIDWLESAESHSISLEELSEGARRDGSHGSRSALPVDRKAGDPLMALIEEERSRNLNAALATLPDDQREILTRYYLRKEGTQFEIAEAMGLSVAALNSRLNRARRELKHAILILRGRDRGDGDGYDPY
jgi:RNA polymerase sigma-70 factor (ECF subfamily)